MLRFSILIPIYNRLQTTKQGLLSLYKALGLHQSIRYPSCSFEVIVIDDGSTDGSSAWIEEHYPAIHLLRGDGNLWWTGAINKGASYATDLLKSDYLLLWNDDIVPKDDYFLELDKVFDSNRFENTIIGSKILFKGNNGKIWSIGGYFNRISGNYGMYTDAGKNADNFFPCDWLPGMGTIVSTSILKRNDILWDEKRFPQYHGDSDFILRCQRKKVDIVTCLSLLIYNDSKPPKPGQSYSFRDLWSGLTALNSNYNVNQRIRFYRIHGIAPLAFFGLLKTYYSYIGFFVKRITIGFFANSNTPGKRQAY